MCSSPFLQFAVDVLPGGPLNDCTMHTPVPVGPASTSSSSVRVHYSELAGSHKQDRLLLLRAGKRDSAARVSLFLGHGGSCPHCPQGKVEPGKAVGGDVSSDGHSPSSAPSPEESSAAPSPTSRSPRAVRLLWWNPGPVCGFTVSVL